MFMALQPGQVSIDAIWIIDRDTLNGIQVGLRLSYTDLESH